MNGHRIDPEAIKQVVRDLEAPAGCASEVMEALVLAVRGLRDDGERRGLVFLATALEQHVEDIEQCFKKAWPAVGFGGPTR